jgi:gamma-glutamyltranspeptidase
VARSGSDIIFAYQLHVIAQKRWWRKQLSADVYAPRSAFLSEDAKVFEEEKATADFATVEQLLNAAEENEYDSVKSSTAGEEGELCACVSFAK